MATAHGRGGPGAAGEPEVKDMTSKVHGDYIVQPVMKALQVLEYVARQGHDVTLTEAVSELKLPKTTVFRYLQTLSAASFLAHDQKRDRYGVGLRFRTLAKLDKSLHRLRQIARPEMVDLMQHFGETVNLAVLADKHVVYIEMVEPDRPLRMHARIGDRHPVHATALGKAIVAFLPDASAHFVPEHEMAAKTFKTLTDARTFKRQVEEVRRRGYAIEVGENEDGLMCIGVPILDSFGLPLAAMSLSAPERRMRPDVTAAAVEALGAASLRIALRLGVQAEEPVEARLAEPA
jgi:IclR family KDG regulon transcriptional repressor